jgi:uncharacterized protein (DUF1697 family)
MVRKAMTRYIAFLRGINLGRRRLAMSHLRELFEQLAFQDVATFIASGNVIFTQSGISPARLESQIETHLAESLGYQVDTFVRSADQLRAIGQARWFAEDGSEGYSVQVSFFKRRLSAQTKKTFENHRTENDRFRVSSRELYWLVRGKLSASRVWEAVELKRLALPTATMRNMTTVRRLIAEHLESG